MFNKTGDNQFNVTKIVSEKKGKVQLTCPICMATYQEGEEHVCNKPQEVKK